jgi:levansucrase
MLIADEQNSSQNHTMCSHWTHAHISRLNHANLPEAAIIDADDARPILPELALWDIWPIQLDDGNVAQVGGGSLWVILSAPRRDDPNLRHDEARMRLLFRLNNEWHDCGNLLPDGFAPGSREWSGSTRVDLETGEVTLWFTAAGRRGDESAQFEQRLFQTTGTLNLSASKPSIADWRDLAQSVTNDGAHYANLAENQGVPGRIKGFRDPYWFRDPADGKGYILFTGSKSAANSKSSHDGVIGIALANDTNGAAPNGFTLLPAVIDADGLVNELERPHVFVQDGLYYLFWSSQAAVFAPGGPAGPTGLYGMVAPSLFGPYEPLNGSGLVLANPSSEPFQAYAWQVVPSLDVVSFVDYWGLKDADKESDPALKTRQFGGTIAPVVKIAISGTTTHIVADVG